MDQGTPQPTLDRHAPPGAPAPPPRRGLYAFAAVAAGILLADALPAVHPAAWFAGACAALIAAALGPGAGARPALACAALLLGAGAMSARILTAPPPPTRLAGIGGDTPLVVRGTVTTLPAQQQPPGAWEPPLHRPPPRWRFELAIDSAQVAGEWRPADGAVTVSIPGPVRLSPGDRAELTGRFHPVHAPVNPGERDARRWAAQEGRAGSLTVESSDALTLLKPDDGLAGRARAALARALAALRAGAGDALDAAAGPAADEPREQSRALLRAMIIGDEDPALRPVSDDMSRLGIVHILSISGFHLVLVSMVVVFLIRLTGDRGVWEHALAAACIGLYLLIVPAQAPVVRSGVMVLALLLTEACGRRYDRLNILAWTACALALWRPLDLFSPGFQLSFGVTAALIWRADAWSAALRASGLVGLPGVAGRARAPAPTFAGRLADHLIGLTIATAIAWTVSAAAVAWHVNVLSLLGVVAGILLTIPSIAAIAAGFVAMLAAAVWPAAGHALGQAAVFFSDLTVQGSRLAAQVPGSAVTLPHVPLAWTVATTAAVVCAIAPGGWKRPAVRAAVLACALWLAALLVAAGLPVKTPTLDRFALPSSSASLVRSADQAVLIDPGSAAQRTGAFTLRRAVAACGAWHVRTVLITGPQTERFSHLPELARALGVQTVLLPPAFERLAAERPDGDQARLLRRLAALGVRARTLREVEGLALGDLTVAVAGPGALRIARAGAPPRPLTLTPLETWQHQEWPR